MRHCGRQRIAAAALWRRTSATSPAKAQEARRVITESARLVRIIGTFAPKTISYDRAGCLVTARGESFLPSKQEPADRDEPTQGNSGQGRLLELLGQIRQTCADLQSWGRPSASGSTAAGPDRIPCFVRRPPTQWGNDDQHRHVLTREGWPSFTCQAREHSRLLGRC